MTFEDSSCIIPTNCGMEIFMKGCVEGRTACAQRKSQPCQQQCRLKYFAVSVSIPFVAFLADAQVHLVRRRGDPVAAAPVARPPRPDRVLGGVRGDVGGALGDLQVRAGRRATRQGARPRH